ncbi:MAG TPA: homoserine dehydrogenase [Nitrospiria bacterium]|nr:homoserine dehydrogenase [Nitrospiria bacterium]
MAEKGKRNEIRVGLIGLGTVGSGVVRVLRSNGDLIRRRLGLPLRLVKAADREASRAKALELEPEIFTTRAEELFADNSIDVVVELIGGYDPAERYLLEAMRRGKCVVTANKALLATAGERLFEAADRHGVEIGFEASVGGGIPIIRALKEGLAANRIEGFSGIINGTSNYILTQMTQSGAGFDEALSQAQRAGYAEADPTFDIDGIDSAHKLAILATLAFGTPVDVKEIHTEGIRGLNAADIAYARELGYRVKLLAIAKVIHGREGGAALELRVHPTMVPSDELIAEVEGVDNAIFVVGDAVGETLFSGKGAGQLPTASAVVSDLIDIGRNLMRGAVGRVAPTGYRPDARLPLRVRPMAEIESVYYLRFQAYDRPGVLSKIAGVLGRYGISIASVIQKSRALGEAVPLIMQTHRAQEQAVRRALAEIDTGQDVAGRTVLIRIEGEEAGDAGSA